MKKFWLLCCLSAIFNLLSAQNPLPYFLSYGSYDAKVPDPERVLGFTPGDWHVTHDQLTRYMYTLAESSDRVRLVEYGRSHEKRPLFVLIFGAPELLARLEELKEERQALFNGSEVSDEAFRSMPGVLYQGYSVHGNEASGSNAAMVVAFHLAASRSEEVRQLLSDNLVFIDPCFNPDGLNRFASWINQNRNMLDNSDGNSRELNEPWPNGRTNHYWFDLNRDYIMAQHPETEGRIRLFREWMPEVFTDHHEMGSDNTLFFQPGIASQVHPLTPVKNQQLTKAIAGYHQRELDARNILYYTGEDYDDYFYGKGSTYPDINGSVGILFEQGSSRGYLRQTENGALSFAFTIRNQVITSLTTQAAMAEMRTELLRYHSEFFRESLRLGRADQQGGILTGSRFDIAKNRELLRILMLHDIEVYASGEEALPYYIPYAQPNYRLIRSLFEARKTFPDSLFYDISAWDLPAALDLEFRHRPSKKGAVTGERILKLPEYKVQMPGYQPAYAYAIRWEDYYAPAMLSGLLQAGIPVKFAKKAFSAETDRGVQELPAGTIVIPMQESRHHPQNLFTTINRLAGQYGVRVYRMKSAGSLTGPMLGSEQFQGVRRPSVGILAGQGTDAYEAGALWHLLDTRYATPVTMIAPSRMNARDLERYTHLLLPSGIPEELRNGSSVLREWVQSGGILIFVRNIGDAKGLGLPGLEPRKSEKEKDKKEWVSFGDQKDRNGAARISGSIFQVEMDATHPLCFGFERTTMSVFRRGTGFFDALPGSDTPVRFTRDYRVAGYIPSDLGTTPAGASYLSARRSGRGKVILMSDNPNFRSYFWGSNRFLANALYFSNGF